VGAGRNTGQWSTSSGSGQGWATSSGSQDWATDSQDWAAGSQGWDDNREDGAASSFGEPGSSDTDARSGNFMQAWDQDDVLDDVLPGWDVQPADGQQQGGYFDIMTGQYSSVQVVLWSATLRTNVGG
jgi:hypothetical protein